MVPFLNGFCCIVYTFKKEGNIAGFSYVRYIAMNIDNMGYLIGIQNLKGGSITALSVKVHSKRDFRG